MGNPTAVFEVWRGQDRLDFQDPFTQGLDPLPATEEPWTHVVAGRFVILDIDDDDELIGDEIRFAVVLEDVEGREVRDERSLVVIPNPFN